MRIVFEDEIDHRKLRSNKTQIRGVLWTCAYEVEIYHNIYVFKRTLIYEEINHYGPWLRHSKILTGCMEESKLLYLSNSGWK